jgi:hypothetical protein
MLPRRHDGYGELVFTHDEVLALARATGLRTKKVRKIAKRFQLVMNEAVSELLNKYKK